MTAKKVLVVDDESSIREMLRLALEISDFECVEAADIHEAYRRVTDDQPDIGKHPVEQHDVRLIVGDPPIGLVNIRSFNTLEI